MTKKTCTALCTDCHEKPRIKSSKFCADCRIRRKKESIQRAKDHYRHKLEDRKTPYDEVETWHPKPRKVLMSDSEQERINKECAARDTFDRPMLTWRHFGHLS